MLIIAHNKMLATQLYGEFKDFFRTMRWHTLSPSRQASQRGRYLVDSHIQMSVYCVYRELTGEINGEWIGCICDFL